MTPAAAAPVAQGPSSGLSTSVIIPAYTLKRWTLLCKAVASVQAQTRRPDEIIICVDHNEELLARCATHWDPGRTPGAVPVRIVANQHGHEEGDLAAHIRAHGSRRRFGAGFARNAAADTACGEILAFLDDDAAAEPDWLAHLLLAYGGDPEILAVGGAPLPDYETSRPRWLPEEFNWVFGCAYRGLPQERSRVEHLIGANMSVRADALRRIGGFHSIDFDDLDMCLRLGALGPLVKVIYEPQARVWHFVGAERVTWSYFWRRCFFVNKHKVRTLTAMKGAASLRAERRFVAQVLKRGTVQEVKGLVRGDKWAAARVGSMALGIVLAGLGNGAGRLGEYGEGRPQLKVRLARYKSHLRQRAGWLG